MLFTYIHDNNLSTEYRNALQFVLPLMCTVLNCPSLFFPSIHFRMMRRRQQQQRTSASSNFLSKPFIYIQIIHMYKSSIFGSVNGEKLGKKLLKTFKL